MKIITIHDGKNGHVSQITGVVSSMLEYNDYKVINIPAIQYLLSFLPNIFFNNLFIGSIVLPKHIKTSIKQALIINQQQTIIIAIGRTTLVASLYAKYLSKKYNIPCQLVYLMPPIKKSNYIDAIFYHSYKGLKLGSKYYPIPTAPHNINKHTIEESKLDFVSNFAHIKKPINAFIIGGNAKKIIFNKKSADTIIQFINQLKQHNNGSIIISTSRRTPKHMEDYLKKSLPNIDFFFGFHENINNKKNPYIAMLNVADNIFITGESISMISEACSFNKPKNVFILFNESFFAKRYTAFHNFLYQNNYANHYLDVFKSNINQESLDSTKIIADTIRKLK